MTANTEIGQQPIYRQQPVQTKKAVQVSEVLWHKNDPVIGRKVGSGITILIESHQATLWSQLVEDGTRMATTPKRTVHIDAIGLDGKTLDHLSQQYGYVIRRLQGC